MGRLRELRSATMRSVSAVAIIIMFMGVVGACSGFSSLLVGQLLGPERIERPQDGFAISLPRDWEHLPGDTYAEGWFKPEFGDARQQHAQYVAEGGVLQARTAWYLAEHEQCDVYDMTEFALAPPAWESLSDAERDMQDWDIVADAAATEMTYLELPVGRVLCVDTIQDADGWDWRSYFYTDGDSWFELVCGSMDPPSDRWHSIAETFEFLPNVAVASQAPDEDAPVLEV